MPQVCTDKLSLFTSIFYTVNPEKPINKLLEIMEESGKMSSFKINILYKTQMHFYKNRILDQKQIENVIFKRQFIVANNIDYFGIN